MSDVPVIPLVDVGLGNSTYLVDLADGRALAVDPTRDLRGVEAAGGGRSCWGPPRRYGRCPLAR